VASTIRRRSAVLGISLLVFAGCGGGSDSPAAHPLSEAQFTAKAGALCRDLARKTPPFPGKRSQNGYVTTASLVVPYLEQVHKLTAESLQELKALTPPAAKQAAVARLVSAQAARVADLRAALKAANTGDAAGFTDAIQRDQKRDGPRYVRAARELGLDACARR
jgi:alkylhydroperoxidase family enzyme